ncbi:trans-aconitate 2-methyltransferase [Sphaerotilus sp.]|uniref:class I SAM-dependent methyltransferase n=1 Tax=Sphaerotilus sp. TaxID=2093942 RepID=UPI0034E1C873
MPASLRRPPTLRPPPAIARTRPATGSVTGRRLPWPLPALLCWALAWGHWLGMQSLDVGVGVSFAGAVLVGSALALLAASRWRRLMIAAGFPLSFALSGLASGWSAVWWLLPLVLLAVAYPVRAWSDAPLFPTGATALDGLDELIELPAQARVLDAGCGLGHGLQALRRVWPQARLEGIEWSRPWRLIAALRCPWARIRQGDMWAQSWAEHDLVYLFQRPESMPRAVEKARREMRPGTWLVSLEFEALGLRPHARLQHPDQRPVWIYAIRDARPGTGHGPHDGDSSVESS